jgi:hypothetical protein
LRQIGNSGSRNEISGQLNNLDKDRGAGRVRDKHKRERREGGERDKVRERTDFATSRSLVFFKLAIRTQISSKLFPSSFSFEE